MYAAKVTIADVLDLAECEDEWESLSEACGETIDPAHYGHHFARAITADDDVCTMLAARGYHWARFRDDYPEGCITIVPVSDEAADEAYHALTEIE